MSWHQISDIVRYTLSLLSLRGKVICIPIKCKYLSEYTSRGKPKIPPADRILMDPGHKASKNPSDNADLGFQAVGRALHIMQLLHTRRRRPLSSPVTCLPFINYCRMLNMWQWSLLFFYVGSIRLAASAAAESCCFVATALNNVWVWVVSVIVNVVMMSWSCMLTGYLKLHSVLNTTDWASGRSSGL